MPRDNADIADMDDPLADFDDDDLLADQPGDDDDEFKDTPESRGDVLEADEPEEEEPEEEEPEEEEPEEDEPEEDEPEEDEPEEDEPEEDEPEEDEPEEDDVPETDEPPEEDNPKKNVRVPIERLDAVIAQKKALEAKLAEIGKGDGKNKQEIDRLTEISDRRGEIDNEMAEASLEGDVKKLKALRAEDRTLESEILEYRLAESRQQAVNTTKFDTALAKFETKYPSLDPDSEEYDSGVVDEVEELLNAFKAYGDSPDVALTRAVSYVIGSRQTVDDEPAPKPEPKKGLRRSTTTPKERNRDAKKRQPPPTTGRKAPNTDDQELDPFKMTNEEFDRFDSSRAGKEARGDFL